MKTCTVCHKFLKQPKYCPKHDPRVPTGAESLQHFLDSRLGVGLSQQNSQLQNDLIAQQLGGLGGLGSLQDALSRGAAGSGQYHPGSMIPVENIPRWSGPRGVGSDVAKWLMPALSWILNPITVLGLKLGILKNKEVK